jgi:hypothetical protein
MFFIMPDEMFVFPLIKSFNCCELKEHANCQGFKFYIKGRSLKSIISFLSLLLLLLYKETSFTVKITWLKFFSFFTVAVTNM